MTIAEREAIAAQAVDWLLDAIQNYIWADATRKDVETVIEVIGEAGGYDVVEFALVRTPKGCSQDAQDLIDAAFHRGDHLADLRTVPQDVVEALATVTDLFARDGECSVERFERLAAWFRKDTGYLAPGKDQPMGGADQPDGDELRAIYDAWFTAKVTNARAALTRIQGQDERNGA